MDRRQRKSRAALENALVALIATKPYADITIEDVTVEADVARATFYAHFKDKPTLLRAATASLIDGLTDTVGAVSSRSGTVSGAGFLAVFRHADEHRNLYRLILSGEGGGDCRTRLIAALERVTTEVFTETLAASGRPGRVPLQVVTLGIVGAMILILEHWLRGDISTDPEVLARQFTQAQVSGIGWALGYEHDEIQFVPPAGAAPGETNHAGLA
jgi:AcrR family transcriptional regulator